MSARPEHLSALLAFKINEMHPFGISQDDLATEALDQAHALVTVLGTAFAESDEVSNSNCALLGRCFDGIATLIALAAFAKNGGAA